MMDVKGVTRKGQENQSSLLLLEVEGQEFDLTNLVSARKANSLNDTTSLYPAKAELLKCCIEVDGIDSNTDVRMSIMRSQSCRDAEKLGSSLYPKLTELDSSLDAEGVADLFSRLSRRKSTGTRPNKTLDTVSGNGLWEIGRAHV